jgi:hypothetical protein
MKIILLAFGLMLLSSCGGPKEKAPAQSEVPLPSTLFSKVTHTPISVVEAKSLAAEKDVVVKGKIMGHRHPFVDNRASFLIGDPEKLVSCEVMGEDDHCSVPWDTCCEPKETIQHNTLNIQVVDQDGRVLKTGLKGKGGLIELAHVVVKGKLALTSTPEATIINAEVIQVIKTSK